MQSLFNNKKGSLTDVIFGPAMILSIIITFFVCWYVWVAISASFETSLLPTLSLSQQLELNQTISNVSIGMTTIDYMMPIIVVGLLIISLIFAFKTGASVIYVILALIMWVFSLILSVVFTNTYNQIDTTLNLGSTFVISNFIMGNLNWIVLGWVALLSIVMFSKNKQETGSISASEQVFR